eukprot:CAMPEP_0194138306 /NCGR_PEP_ID=MMETSP0152-20130528/8136_1 /TAXON_ID=1049557 /ORGANISM="Thalassiothrix antarctica, Strain L6-D1" /LENGTH=711 /DNA_ID=CAMNT_0038835733 /DNA_START=193 /DNA_END=2328 /DNA_ORIENTATION=+
MMNYIISFSVLLLAVCQVQSISESAVRSEIKRLQKGLSYLDDSTLTDSSSYQKQAENAAVSTLTDQNKLKAFIADRSDKGNNFDWEDKHIKNFYTAACVFFATNGVSNLKVKQFQPTDFVVPAWDKTDDWITNPDYCSWFGLKCFLDTLGPEEIEDQQLQDQIIEIQLFNNSLYGEWPPEIGLLGDNLVTIDLYDNFFQYTDDYSWFDSMKEMKYLWFGTTSWSADGIPTELNKLTNLEQLDCSYTFWSEGPLNANAFDDLSLLQYFDIGDNIYDPPDDDTLPSSITQLPTLTRFYMDNVKFVDDNNVEKSFPLDFLSDMDSVIEAWFDFTKFSSGIPTLPANLKSFSCVFCGLDGDLDNLVDSPGVELDRVWLSGNDLTGEIPSNLGADNKFTNIYLEANDGLVGPYPESLCSNEDGILQEVGGTEEICGASSCCTCTGESCGNLPDPTASPTVPPSPLPIGFCFSGESMVNVENKGSMQISNLVLGDVVQVANNKFEPIYSFGHKDDSSFVKYLQIATEGQFVPLEISDDHMVSVSDGRYVPASTIKKGDMLFTSSGEVAAVKSIKSVMRKGAYAPFTSSGSIVVNNIVASNYIAYQGSNNLKIGIIDSGVSYQWIAHSFNSIHRLAVMMGCTSETYTEAGVSNWVNLPHVMFEWVLEQNALVGSALLLPAFLIIGFASMIEYLVSNPVMMMCAMVGGYFICQKSGKTV